MEGLEVCSKKLRFYSKSFEAFEAKRYHDSMVFRDHFYACVNSGL